MPLKILHTADVHLGMNFRKYEPAVQSSLKEARFTTLEKLIARANSEQCDLFTVGGDLFHTVNEPKKLITRAAGILNGFSGKQVLVLAGNHDYAIPGQEDLWAEFRKQADDHVVVLTEPEIADLSESGISACVYPAPCTAKHSPQHNLDWIMNSPKDKELTWHIGMAHGSLAGLSPDFDKQYYPMTKADLESCKLDLWLMGHTHISYPHKPGKRDRIYYPGTPEPDGFDCRHGGSALLLTIDEEKNLSVDRLEPGQYRFTELEQTLQREEDVAALAQSFAGGAFQNSLVRLVFSGVLEKDAREALHQLRATIAEQCLLQRWDESGLLESISAERINKEFTAGSAPHQLLMRLVEKGEQRTLQLAWEIVQEVRQ